MRISLSSTLKIKRNRERLKGKRRSKKKKSKNWRIDIIKHYSRIIGHSIPKTPIIFSFRHKERPSCISCIVAKLGNSNRLKQVCALGSLLPATLFSIVNLDISPLLLMSLLIKLQIREAFVGGRLEPEQNWRN